MSTKEYNIWPLKSLSEKLKPAQHTNFKDNLEPPERFYNYFI